MAWNGSNNANDAASKKSAAQASSAAKPAWMKGALAGLLVVILAAAAFFFLKPETKRPVTEKAAKKASVLEEVKPAAASKAREETVAPKKIPYWKRETTNGLSEVQMRKWWAEHRPKPTWTNTTSLSEARPAYAIFEHRSENEIAFYLSLEPGEMLVGTPVYGKTFEKDFLKSLTDVIAVSKDDSKEVAELKRAVIAAKIEIKERMDNGEKLGDILLSIRKEYQDLANYKQTLQQEVLNSLRERDDVSDIDVETAIQAANKMLEAKGVAPMKVSPLIRYGIKRRAKLMKK